ncbi:MAG: hypothetical protein NC118_03460 [Eubacterium sp.]|nr:hypothetical protein [Eubacterium sp.]
MKMELFDNAMEINIPDGFIYNENCIRYPYRNKPVVILTNEESNIDITFNRLNKSLTKKHTKAAIQAVLLLLEERRDISKTSTHHFFQGENVDGYWISYVNRGMHDSFMNFIAVFPIGNQFTIETLSTVYDNKGEGKILFLNTIISVKDKTRGIFI